MKNMKVRTKLILIFLLIGLAPFIIISFVSYGKAGDALQDAEFNKFRSIQSLKKEMVEDLFEKVRIDISILSTSGDLNILYRELVEYHKKMNIGPQDPFIVDSEDYRQIWQEKGKYMAEFNKKYGYYDLFLICAKHGHVMYTAEKEPDLGTNLRHGPFKEEGLAKVWKAVVETGRISFNDFEPYAPSKGAQAAFIGAPIKDDSGNTVGVVVLQLPIDPIHHIVHNREGLGKTGETYLVGEVEGKTYYRSDRQIKDGKIGQERGGKFVKKAFNGETGVGEKVGSTGEKELVGYAPVKIEGLNWVIITTMSMDEALAEVYSLRYYIGGTAVVAIAIIIILTLLVVGIIYRTITAFTEKFSSVGEGDLTTRLDVTSSDEVGKLSEDFNDFIDSLESLVRSIGDSSNKVLTSSGEVAGGNNQLSSATQEMASSLEQTAASIEEITSSIKDTADVSNVSTKKIRKTVEQARGGAEMLKQMSEAMKAVRESGKRIEEMVSAVNNIAFQTNLLSQCSG